jgi:S-disulfanyl-L-cysteine oxidoreductase SoxD
VGTLAAGAALLAAAGMANGLELAITPSAVQISEPSNASTPVAQAEVDAPKATYTAAQADRGKAVFSEDCVECHGKDLRGGLLGGPPLRGQAFEAKYGKGSPAGVLFEVMSTTMPPNDPGRYSDPTYADLMAYILKTNGYKAGAELPSEVDALYELVIDK